VGLRDALTRKLGPLPAWAWGGIAGAGLFLYNRYRPKSEEDLAVEEGLEGVAEGDLYDATQSEMYPVAAGGWTPGTGGGPGDWWGDSGDVEPGTPDVGGGDGFEPEPFPTTPDPAKEPLTRIQRRRANLRERVERAQSPGLKRKLRQKLDLSKNLQQQAERRKEGNGQRPGMRPKRRRQPPILQSAGLRRFTGQRVQPAGPPRGVRQEWTNRLRGREGVYRAGLGQRGVPPGREGIFRRRRRA
jgi:hypothetical protein